MCQQTRAGFPVHFNCRLCCQLSADGSGTEKMLPDVEVISQRGPDFNIHHKLKCQAEWLWWVTKIYIFFLYKLKVVRWCCWSCFNDFNSFCRATTGVSSSREITHLCHVSHLLTWQTVYHSKSLPQSGRRIIKSQRDWQITPQTRLWLLCHLNHRRAVFSLLWFSSLSLENGLFLFKRLVLRV